MSFPGRLLSKCWSVVAPILAGLFLCSHSFALPILPCGSLLLSPSGKLAGGTTGGWWATDANGKNWFVKKDVLHPHLQTSAEVIGSQVYRYFGYSTPETIKFERDGIPYVAVAEVIEIKGNTNFSELNSRKVRQLRVIAAFLKDWDRIAEPTNNLKVGNEEVYLIDFGGTLGARAKGEYKPGEIVSPAIGAFEATADYEGYLKEFSMRSAGWLHPWRRLNSDDYVDLLPKFQTFSDEIIEKIVQSAQYPTEWETTYMTRALKTRRDGFIDFVKARCEHKIPFEDEPFNKQELAAVQSYMHNGAWATNDFLRSGIAIQDSELCIGCATLLSALNKLKDFVGIVFRRVKMPDEQSVEPYLTRGNIVEDKGFSSATRSYFGAPPFRGNSRGKTGLMLIIRSRTGKDISRFGLPWEREILFRPGTRMKVDFAIKRLNGSHVVFLTEIPN